MRQSDNDISHTLLNILLKEGFRQTSLRQLGAIPRFFDTKKAVQATEDLMIMPGFRATAMNTQSGLIVTLDSLNKFTTT